jgi:LuxR family transcriptional regulator, maltose regulon positive regulatory protein
VARGGSGAARAAPRFAQHNPHEATATLAPVRDGSVSWARLLRAALLLEGIADDEPGDPDAGRVPERAAVTAGADRVLFPALIRPAPEPLGRRAQHGPTDAAMISEAADLPGEPLTRSETRVLRYLPTHLSAREIAGELYLSVNTIKTHLRHLYRKLGAHSRHEAVQRARAIGLLAASSRRMLPPPAAAAPV